jgi:hypothetical protein
MVVHSHSTNAANEELLAALLQGRDVRCVLPRWCRHYSDEVSVTYRRGGVARQIQIQTARMADG